MGSHTLDISIKVYLTYSSPFHVRANFCFTQDLKISLLVWCRARVHTQKLLITIPRYRDFYQEIYVELAFYFTKGIIFLILSINLESVLHHFLFPFPCRRGPSHPGVCTSFSHQALHSASWENCAANPQATPFSLITELFACCLTQRSRWPGLLFIKISIVHTDMSIHPLHGRELFG